MNVLSLFDGMSCGMIALERAGIKVDKYYASEIDSHAMDISTKNYPQIQQVGDVSKIRANKVKIDLLIGGSPCQGFSRAGKGENFEDPRSKLFYEFVRILKETNPKYFLLENVCMKKEWEDKITDILGVQPVKINSKLFVPHNRPRVYWTNIPFEKNIIQKEYKIQDFLDQDFPEKKYIKQHIFDSIVIEKQVDHLVVKNATKQGWLKAYPGDAVSVSFPNSKTRRGRVKKNMVGCITTKPHEAIVTDDLRLRYITTEEAERFQGLPTGYTEGIPETQRERAIGNGWTVDVISYIFKYMK